MKSVKPSNARNIIVNADDFGLSADVNRAIVDAFQNHRISSATLMANMPGFEEACELVHQHRLLGKVGVHLNLTSGRPLSVPIRACPRFCDPEEQQFRCRRTRLWLSKKERLAVETEIAAQIRACLDRNIVPTHLDSHHHVHTEWPIGAAAISVARRYGIKAIRLTRNCGSGIDLVRRSYKFAYNTRLRLYGMAKTQYFGSASDIQNLAGVTHGLVEIMVHLATPSNEDTPGSESTLAKLQDWAPTQRLISY